jgi:hypothetical protein
MRFHYNGLPAYLPTHENSIKPSYILLYNPEKFLSYHQSLGGMGNNNINDTYEPFCESNILRFNHEKAKEDESLQALLRAAKSVDLSKLRMDLTYLTHTMKDINFGVEIADDTITEMKKLIVAQAKIDALAHSEAGLIIRWMTPRHDLADEYGDDLQFNSWWIPPHADQDEGFTKPDQEVFCTNMSRTRNDRKVYLIFGVGFGADATRVVTTCTVKRSDVKTLAVISMSHLERGQVAPIDPVILMKRSDDLAVWVSNDKQKYANMRDHLIIYGWVCEATGLSVYASE